MKERTITSNTLILFIAPIFGAYAMTFITCELIVRIPIINFLYGAARKSKNDLLK